MKTAIGIMIVGLAALGAYAQDPGAALGMTRAPSVKEQKGPPPAKKTAPAAKQASGTTTAEVKPLIRAAVSNFTAHISYPLRMKVDCPELANTFEAEMTKRSPMPIPINITQVYAVCRDNRMRFEFELGTLPEPMRGLAEQKLNTMVREPPHGDVLNKLTGHIMTTAAKLLLDQESIDVIARTPELLDLEVNEMDEPFILETRIKSIRMKIDPKLPILRSADLVLDKKRYLKFKASFIPFRVPGRATEIFVPSEATCDQNVGALGLTQPFTFKYSDHQFMKLPAVTQTPAAAAPTATP